MEIGKNDAFFEHENALDQACESSGTFEMSDLTDESAFMSSVRGASSSITYIRLNGPEVQRTGSLGILDHPLHRFDL